MSRMPGASWQPLGADWASQPRMRAHNIVCIHTMVGGLEGTDALFRVANGPGFVGTESHYGTSWDGRIVQWQDTAYQAEANYLGNGEVISIENADFGTGFPKWNGSDVPAFSDDQVEAIAHILAWECSLAAHAGCPPSWVCHQVGIPLALVPDSLPGRRGIAPHRWGVPGYMVAGGVQWSTSQGKACPGDRRIAQIPRIIARAIELTRGIPPVQEESNMTVIQPGEEGVVVIKGVGHTRLRIACDPYWQRLRVAVGLKGGGYAPWPGADGKTSEISVKPGVVSYMDLPKDAGDFISLSHKGPAGEGSKPGPITVDTCPPA